MRPNQLIVFTGVSGSGKSSLAFDTVYIEGQRRYIESLSTYARRFLGSMPKPDAERIDGISPTIAIEQKQGSNNPRSTVGTLTGVYDFLRVLYAKLATPYCPIANEPVKPQSTQNIIDQIMSLEEGTKIYVLSPLAKGKKSEFKEEFQDLLKKGFTRVFIDEEIQQLNDLGGLDGSISHDVDVVFDRIAIKKEDRNRITEAIITALEFGKGMVSIYNTSKNEKILFSQNAYCEASNKSYPPLEPTDFSFNHVDGMCSTCEGLGQCLEFDIEKIIDPARSISEDCCIIAPSYNTVKWGNIYQNLAKIGKFNVKTPWKDLPEQAKKLFLYGTNEKWTKMVFTHPTTGQYWSDYVQYKGVIFEAKKRLAESKSDSYRKKIELLMKDSVCEDCMGARIKPYPAYAKFKGLTIQEFTNQPIDETLSFLSSVALNEEEEKIGSELIKEICSRLNFLNDVGLHYLTLSRSSPTLSGGEMQRVRLAAQIGCGLVGTTYVLDEPSIGLHDRDHQKLIQSLKNLRDQGNTVIVVEHDTATMQNADYIVDLGPGAGIEGGKIMAQGDYEAIINSPDSLTGQYLSGRKTIEIPKKKRKAKGYIELKGAKQNNLQNVDLKLPLSVFTAITGVSGSGKSSLIIDTLFPALSNVLQKSKLAVGPHEKILGIEQIDKVIEIDQSPIGRTSRSNPATYIKLFDEIRSLFSQLPESQAFGYAPGHFSFNVKEGSCTRCSGLGFIKIDMDFLEDETVVCPECDGRRFSTKILSVELRGKNIYDVLNFSVNEALTFFDPYPTIHKKLSLLKGVGLGYIKLGQASTTLSGGEAQRIKLAKELSRPSTGKTLYILDEPTTGLHFEDINKLIQILQKLVDEGNTVVVIEHNLDLIKTVDWIIDVGPEGGKGGGKIIAEGTPKEVAKKNTPTGESLASLFNDRTILKKIADPKTKPITEIEVEGAEQHNLKKVSAKVPRGAISVCLGPSGSGKTSFALDTLYAEGQRRFVESLYPYAKQFIQTMPKPKVDRIEGLSPAIAIEQKKHAGNPRSTVGTITEIYDFLRILFSSSGTPHCPETGEKIVSISKDYVANKIMQYPEKTKVQVLSKIDVKTLDDFNLICETLLRQGYMRIRLNNEYYQLEDKIPFSHTKKNTLYLVIDRLMIKSGIEKRLLEAIEKATSISKNHVTFDINGEDKEFNLAFCVESTGKSYPTITPQTFSFNSEEGMCMHCSGLGFVYGAYFDDDADILNKSLIEIMSMLWKETATELSYKIYLSLLQLMGFNGESKLRDLSEEQKALFFGGGDIQVALDGKTTFSWKGLSHLFQELAKHSTKKIRFHLDPYLTTHDCPVCKGDRLNGLARKVTIDGKSLPEVCSLPSQDALHFIKQLDIKKSKSIGELLSQIEARLHFICEIGLDYLALNRSAPTLSGGETQRIHLARQLGSGLTGCLYVLDEPTIGLHPHNNELLNRALIRLKELGNTLVLVEHDPMTIAIADKILEFGPQSGSRGGEITFEGTIDQLKSSDTITGQYLTKKRMPDRKIKSFEKHPIFSVGNANIHNLKNISVSFPIGRLSCITGVSGCGKSTLLFDVIYQGAKKALIHETNSESFTLGDVEYKGFESFTNVLLIDQNPVGHSARSDVSTYIDLLGPLRSFFASLPEASIRGLMPRNFSFNHLSGMCRSCWGLGYKNIDLQFLPSVRIKCPDCNGYRLNPLSLKVTYKNRHLGEFLDMTIEDAEELLPPIPKLNRMVAKMKEIGLGYLKFNQQVATLSCGESQRLRLAKELMKRSKGHTLYLFDEPTTGLHNEDIMKLVPILSKLVDKGHTVIMIEHHLDMIHLSDYVVDLGPGAGMHGGEVIFSGSVKNLLKEKNSYTSQHLNNYLKD